MANLSALQRFGFFSTPAVKRLAGHFRAIFLPNAHNWPFEKKNEYCIQIIDTTLGIYSNWKSIKCKWVFLKSKSFPLRHNRYFDPKVIYIIIFSKSVCWFKSFLLDSSLQPKIFQNFLASNSFYFLNRLWNVKLSDMSFYFTVLFLLQKSQIFV